MQNTLIIFTAKYLFLAIVLVAGIYWWKQDKTTKKRIVVLACMALPIAFIMSRIGSLLYFDPRPFVTGNFVPLIPHAPDNGFPSDHTLISASVASVIYFSHKKLGILLLIIAFVVGASRMLAGVHSFADIAGSIIIAFGVTWLAHFFFVRYGRMS